MNKNERQAVLKMLLIREDLTDKEFVNAIDFIKKELIGEANTEKILKQDFSMKKKSRDTILELLTEVKREHPDKYELLMELYKYVQDATIFKTVADARKFGNMIGLKNTNSQTKQEVISNIFETLTKMSHEVILEQMSKVEFFSAKSDDSYQRLSKFIMTPKER